METARPARPDVPAPGDGGSEAVQLPGRFEHFYLEEFPAVVALAYALSGSRTGAEDIAQEAFLRAYRDWDRVGSYVHRVAWVRRVAANLATSGLRRRVVEARALIRLAGRWEPAVDPLPAENAEFWAAVRALPVPAGAGGGAVLPGGSVDPADGGGAGLCRGDGQGAPGQGAAGAGPAAAAWMAGRRDEPR